MHLEDLALIGNCQYSALVDRDGSVAWCCLPRFDAEPVFGKLMDEQDGGHFTIGPADGGQGTQRYIENTNVVETRFDGPDGSFRVIDFAPRFEQFDRSFRPTKLVRIVEPLSGTPRVKVSCEPVLGWSKQKPRREQGSNHIAWQGYDVAVRLTTDVPLSYMGGIPFALTKRQHFVFAWGAPVEEALQPLCDRFLRETTRYWHRWVKHCDVPPMYQPQVIRSALALKLHCFEDTGAIVAATTTSIPESKGSGRTWDYRYCWLRDSYYSLNAFRLLGHYEEREQFLSYLLTVASSTRDLDLAPLYRIDGRSDLGESILTNWAGFNGEQPVRIGNQAAEHKQHDVFGEMVMALAPLYLDDRFHHEQSPSTLELLTRLGKRAIDVAGQPDAGIWEFRSDWRPQSFSTLMCWAAADRMASVSQKHVPSQLEFFRGAAEKLKAELLSQGWNAGLGSLVATYGGGDIDAAMLQAATLRLLPAGDPRLHQTIDAIQKELSRDGWLMRYRNDDGFGVPTVAFVICTFWLIEALALADRLEEARTMMDRVCGALTPLGLIAEDRDTQNGRMWGNFPQAYSHVGLIHAAFAASPRWSEVL